MTATGVAATHPKYEMVVGLEVHVQLRTRTKLFCNCPTEFGAPPNRNTCPVCLGLPGSLPVLNEAAVELATRAALALGAEVREASVFARKNYFYPDLPKGYQISQFDRPLAVHGHLVIGERPDGAPLRIGITRIHMEEDAGKSVHDRFPSFTAIDLNRAGTPLIEIVSEPDIRSSAEAGSYCRLLRQILEYVDVSDLNMEEGSLRVDANISIRERGGTKLGTKTELKNLNSFSAVERTLDAEFERQVAIVEARATVEQQTLLWDADRGVVGADLTGRQARVGAGAARGLAGELDDGVIHARVRARLLAEPDAVPVAGRRCRGGGGERDLLRRCADGDERAGGGGGAARAVDAQRRAGAEPDRDAGLDGQRRRGRVAGDVEDGVDLVADAIRHAARVHPVEALRSE